MAKSYLGLLEALIILLCVQKIFQWRIQSGTEKHGRALLMGNDTKETRVVLVSSRFAEYIEWALCRSNRKSAVITFREYGFFNGPELKFLLKLRLTNIPKPLWYQT